MQINRDFYNNLEVPDFVLCKANRERIGVIFCTDKIANFNFNDLDNIEFTTYYMIDDEKNPIYDSIEVMKYIYVQGVGFYYIKTCNIQSEGSEHEYKEVTAESYEGLLGQKYLENFKVNTGDVESKELDYDDTGSTPIYIWLSPQEKLSTGKKDLFDYVLEKCPDWYVSYVDPILLEEGRSHRSFEIDRKDVYSFIMEDIQDAFECYVEFDTLNLDNRGRCAISIYAQENYKYDTNIYVSYDNLLKNTNISSSTDDIKTCVVLEGEDELEIREINFGYDRIYNFDYYNNTDFWSQKLYDEYNAWHDKVYEIGSIQRSPNVYTEDLSDEELAAMSYLDLYKMRLNSYLEALVELDEINTRMSTFVNDDDRGIGSGEFPVFDADNNEVGSITFEQDVGVYITENLPANPPYGMENYIFITKKADVNLTQLKSNLSVVENGKDISYSTTPAYACISMQYADKLGADYRGAFDTTQSVNNGKYYKITDIDYFHYMIDKELQECTAYLDEFEREKQLNYIIGGTEFNPSRYFELDYTKFNQVSARINFLNSSNQYIEWIEAVSIPFILKSIGNNLINYNSVYLNYLESVSNDYYKITNESAYKSQIAIDESNLKNLIEVGASTSTVTYPGYCIYRWFDNTDTVTFYNALVSANTTYKASKTISVEDATTLRDFNPLYNTCLIIGSSTVDISRPEDFEEYLEADLTEQTALVNIFPTSTWFNTNDWRGYGYSELTDTWALTVDQELTVLKKDNKGNVPDAYKDAEVDSADHYWGANSVEDRLSAWYYFGEYLPCYLTQLAIESQISALDAQIDGYEVYPYTLTSKGDLSFNELPTSENIQGDTYNITNDFVLNGTTYPKGTNVTWDGTKWVITSSIATHIDGIQDKINKQQKYKAQVVNEIQLDNNLTEPSRMELSAFIREEELNSDNFIVTDTMTEEERQEMLESFLKYGEKELSKICVPQLSFTANISNLYSIPEFDAVSADFEQGKNIQISLRDDYYIKATLLSVHVNYYDPSDFTMTFSDILKKSKGIYTDIQEAINTATSAATSVAIGSSSWSEAATTATKINTSLQEGLLSQGNYLSDNPAKSTFVIDDTGIFVDTASGDYGKYDVFGEEKYVYDSIYIGGGRILFTDDGWKHVRMSLGRSKVTRVAPGNPSGTTSEEFGVFADFVISGYVAGSQICGGELYSSAFAGNNPVSYFNLDNGTFTIRSKSTGRPVMSFNGNTLSLGGYATETDIQDERNSREQSESALRQGIDQVSNNLAQEVSDRENADSTLNDGITNVSDNLDTEISNRENGDIALGQGIDTVSNNLDKEITDRMNVDNTLSAAIDAESEARIASYEAMDARFADYTTEVAFEQWATDAGFTSLEDVITLKADHIKTGFLSAYSNKSWINMDTGAFNFGGGKLKIPRSGSDVKYGDVDDESTNYIAWNPNDGTLFVKGDIYANNGVFNGTVYAEDGVFNGTVYAEDGEFNGTIYAENGEIGGFTIDSSNLSSSNVYLGTDGLRIKCNSFVDGYISSGFSISSNGIIHGGKATFCNWTIDGGTICYRPGLADENYFVDLNAAGIDPYLKLGTAVMRPSAGTANTFQINITGTANSASSYTGDSLSTTTISTTNLYWIDSENNKKNLSNYKTIQKSFKDGNGNMVTIRYIGTQ